MINPCGLGPVSRVTKQKIISNRKEQRRETVPRLETLWVHSLSNWARVLLPPGGHFMQSTIVPSHSALWFCSRRWEWRISSGPWDPLSLISEKAMAPHSSTLAWKIPCTEEPGRLQSMGSLKVRHKWATSLSLFIFMHWRRTWQPTPVFLPGESQGQGSLVGCRLWGRTESDTTEAT